MRAGRTRSLAKLVTRSIMKNLDYRPRLGQVNLQIPDDDSIFFWNSKWNLDDPDIDSRSFTVFLKLKRKKGSDFDIGAEVSTDMFGEAVITFEIFYDRHNKQSREAIYMELLGIAAHEIEHLTEDGPLCFPGPRQSRTYLGFPESGKLLHNLNDMYKHFSKDENRAQWAQRDLIGMLNSFENEENYLICALELNAFVKGFYVQASTAKKPIDFFMRSYLSDYVKFGRLQQDQADFVLERWRAWSKLRFPRAKWSDN